jgi:histone acetyltransferase (RNA polymerase elongator complex component)
MSAHVNIPIFIPHLGCSNQCVFCNQRSISGVKFFDKSTVKEQIDNALETINENSDVEIAFFGGSFTGIDRDLMIYLLELAYSYVKSGKVSGIRCSTRPDYINDEILDILEKYCVRVIELGLQSSDDRVLSASKRGHSFDAEKRACKLIVDRGFALVGQMMIGLPDSTPENEIETAEFIISSGAVAARIYPTVVFRDTELCSMAMRGEYIPLSLDDAVKRTAEVMKRFITSGIDVIRIGLHSSENLHSDQTYYAGPNHPALGELVINEIYYGLMADELSKIDDKQKSNARIFVGRGMLSKAIGQKKSNLLRLKDKFPFINITISEDEDIPEYSISVER